MDYLIQLRDFAGKYHATISLSEAEAKRPAIDVVFDVIGCDAPEKLVAAKTIHEEAVDDLKALQAIVFDKDAEGFFIRDGVTFTANGKDLNPDAPMDAAFETVEHEGMRYGRCDLLVRTPGMAAPAQPAAAAPAPQSAAPAPQLSQEEQMHQLGLMMLMHQLSIGTVVDVTRDNPDLSDLLDEAEKKGWTEINVQKASYRLSAAGRAQYDAWVGEAQDLIHRYDIYGDVDVDSTGKAYFDTGAGQDLRVAVWEIDGIDPFRARFLLGLNDGEWDQLSTWRSNISDPQWYGEIFAPIENAPSADDIGRDRLRRVMDQAKAQLHGEMV